MPTFRMMPTPMKLRAAVVIRWLGVACVQRALSAATVTAQPGETKVPSSERSAER